jgi:hypothetical protein
MIINRILFLCGLLVSALLHAQDVSVTYGTKFSLRDRGLTQKEGSTIRVGDYFYCIETDYKSRQLLYTVRLNAVKYDVNVYKFDSGMKQLNKFALDGQYSLGPFPPQVAFFGGNLLVFYYKLQDNGAIQLLFAAIDPETMKASPGKLLYAISEKNTGMFRIAESFDLNRLTLALSADSSKLLVAQSGNINEVCTAVIKKDLSFAKPVVSKVKGNLDGFRINSGCLDTAGNRYFTYDYIEDKQRKNGVLVQNIGGKEGWLAFRPMQDATEAGLLWVKPSRDNAKVYVYGIALGQEWEEGVLLATVDAAKLKLANPQVFPYPLQLREKLYKMDFANKKHGNLEVSNAFYLSSELEDGTLVLTGYPQRIATHSHMSMTGMNGGTTTTSEVYAGPIINIFIRNGKSSFGVIYRDQTMTNASMMIPIPYHDKLVCIYNDNEKSIGSDDLRINGKGYEMKDLVLAVAVIGNDGTIISRKKLATKQGNLTFFTDDRQRLSSASYLVPLGRDRVNMIRYFTEYEQWATIKVN